MESKKIYAILFSVAIFLSGACFSLRAQHVVTLDDCLEMATKQNKQVEINKVAQHSAQLKKDEVASYLLPQISAQGAVLTMNDPIRLIDWDYWLGPFSVFVPQKLRSFTEIKTDNIVVGNVTAVQPIFMGGKIFYGMRMASAAHRLTKAMGETERTKVEDEVTDTYWKVVSLSSKRRLLKKLLHLLSQARHNVDIAIKTGVATRADGLAIRVKQSDAELKLNKVNDGLHLLQMLLAEQCGLNADSLLIPADISKLDALEPIREQEDTTVVAKRYDIDRAIALRSEIRSLTIADTVFANKEKMVRADMLPKLVGIASYTVLTPNPFHEPRNGFGQSWAIGLGVQIPITGILQGSIKYREAKDERLTYQLKKEEAQQKIKLQIKQQIFKIAEADKSLQSAAEGLAHAEENLKYANVGYNEGVIPLINLTVAQTEWAKAHDAYIDAWIDKQIALSKAKRIIPQ